MSVPVPRLITLNRMCEVTLINLGLSYGPNIPPPLTVYAATLRASLWALSNGGTQPVHVTRLIHAARRLAEPLLLVGCLPSCPEPGEDSDDLLKERLRTALGELETIGDVAQMPGGRWLSAPLRCVPLPPICRWVLVGGLPSHQLPSALGSAVVHMGAVRFLRCDPADLGVPLYRQSEAAWCGVSHQDPVDTWAERVLNDAETLPFSDADAMFEFYYYPESARAVGSRANLQYFRWTERVSALPDGRYLARSRWRVLHRRYLIADVRRGRVVTTGPLTVDGGDLRRLLYGLDAVAGFPVSVKVTRFGDSWHYELRNELPQAEQRLLTALGRLHLPTNGRYYPRTWEVPDGYAAQVTAALQRLGIRLEATAAFECGQEAM